MKNEGSGALNFIGIIMIIFGLAYAILGTLSIVGVISGVSPCLENQKLTIILLTYITSIIAIIGGIISIKGNYKNIQTIGIIFAIIGLISFNKVGENSSSNTTVVEIQEATDNQYVEN